MPELEAILKNELLEFERTRERDARGGELARSCMSVRDHGLLDGAYLRNRDRLRGPGEPFFPDLSAEEESAARRLLHNAAVFRECETAGEVEELWRQAHDREPFQTERALFNLVARQRGEHDD